MKTNYSKLACFILALLGFTAVNAQTMDPTSANVTQTNAAGEIIRLIDNKGTIKYMQANNGITTITSTTAGELTTTTWQLGGTLLDDTNITTGAQEFKLTLNDGTNQGSFVINGIVEETGSAATSMGGTGYTLIVRDETTGEIRNLLVTDLIQSGQVTDTVDAGEETADTIVIAAAGLSTDINQIWVYRNGAKLIQTTDFIIAADQITVAGTANFSLYAGDIIEIQWVK